MNQSKTLTIQLPAEDWERLENQARKLDLSFDAFASMLLRQRLDRSKSNDDTLNALLRLRQLTDDLLPIDPVEIVRAGRQSLEQRGIF